MTSTRVLTFSLIVSLLTFCHGDLQQEDEFLYDTFPEGSYTCSRYMIVDVLIVNSLGFRWGFATAAYQIEGAWNIDGKLQTLQLTNV